MGVLTGILFPHTGIQAPQPHYSNISTIAGICLEAKRSFERFANYLEPCENLVTIHYAQNYQNEHYGDYVHLIDDLHNNVFKKFNNTNQNFHVL